MTEAMAPPAERPVTNVARQKPRKATLWIVGRLLLRIDNREAETVGEGRPAGATVILVCGLSAAM